MQYVFFEKEWCIIGSGATSWKLGTGEFSRIFVLKVSNLTVCTVTE